MIASQSGIVGHLKLGNQATVGAKSGVMRDVPDRGTVLGIPAAPDKQAKRQMIAVQHLPEIIRGMRELESRWSNSVPRAPEIVGLSTRKSKRIEHVRTRSP